MRWWEENSRIVDRSDENPVENERRRDELKAIVLRDKELQRTMSEFKNAHLSLKMAELNAEAASNVIDSVKGAFQRSLIEEEPIYSMMNVLSNDVRDAYDKLDAAYAKFSDTLGKLTIKEPYGRRFSVDVESDILDIMKKENSPEINKQKIALNAKIKPFGDRIKPIVEDFFRRIEEHRKEQQTTPAATTDEVGKAEKLAVLRAQAEGRGQ